MWITWLFVLIRHKNTSLNKCFWIKLRFICTWKQTGDVTGRGWSFSTWSLTCSSWILTCSSFVPEVDLMLREISCELWIRALVNLCVVYTFVWFLHMWVVSHSQHVDVTVQRSIFLHVHECVFMYVPCDPPLSILALNMLHCDVKTATLSIWVNAIFNIALFIPAFLNLKCSWNAQEKRTNVPGGCPGVLCSEASPGVWVTCCLMTASSVTCAAKWLQ